jgi:ribosomal protein L11 methyltransferase
MNDDLTVFDFTCTDDEAGVFDEFLAAADMSFSYIQNVDTGICKFTVYIGDDDVIEEVEARLNAVCNTAVELADCKLREPVLGLVKHENWAESWKLNFPVTRLSNRVIVKPPWEQVDANVDDVVLEINPGMSFGTGHHGTTKACVQFLDELEQSGVKGPVLDLGCGSGILSMAALALGFDRVVAVDNDPQACGIAQENLGAFDSARWTVENAGVEDFIKTIEYPLVVANILAGVLVEHAATIVQHVEHNGGLILSGILDSQFADVENRFARYGMRLREARLIDEWRSGLFVCEART